MAVYEVLFLLVLFSFEDTLRCQKHITLTELVAK